MAYSKGSVIPYSLPVSGIPPFPSWVGPKSENVYFLVASWEPLVPNVISVCRHPGRNLTNSVIKPPLSSETPSASSRLGVEAACLSSSTAHLDVQGYCFALTPSPGIGNLWESVSPTPDLPTPTANAHSLSRARCPPGLYSGVWALSFCSQSSPAAPWRFAFLQACDRGTWFRLPFSATVEADPPASPPLLSPPLTTSSLPTQHMGFFA